MPQAELGGASLLPDEPVPPEKAMRIAEHARVARSPSLVDLISRSPGDARGADIVLQAMRARLRPLGDVPPTL